MSHLDYFYRLFPIRITAGFVIPIRKSVGLLQNVKLNSTQAVRRSAAHWFNLKKKFKKNLK